MLQIFVNDSFEDIINNNIVSVIRSSPVASRTHIKYIGNGFAVTKIVKKVQLHWSGKKNIFTQNVEISKPQQVMRVVQEINEQQKIQQNISKQKRRK